MQAFVDAVRSLVGPQLLMDAFQRESMMSRPATFSEKDADALHLLRALSATNADLLHLLRALKPTISVVELTSQLVMDPRFGEEVPDGEARLEILSRDYEVQVPWTHRPLAVTIEHRPIVLRPQTNRDRKTFIDALKTLVGPRLLQDAVAAAQLSAADRAAHLVADAAVLSTSVAGAPAPSVPRSGRTTGASLHLQLGDLADDSLHGILGSCARSGRIALSQCSKALNNAYWTRIRALRIALRWCVPGREPAAFSSIDSGCLVCASAPFTARVLSRSPRCPTLNQLSESSPFRTIPPIVHFGCLGMIGRPGIVSRGLTMRTTPLHTASPTLLGEI